MQNGYRRRSERTVWRGARRNYNFRQQVTKDKLSKIVTTMKNEVLEPFITDILPIGSTALFQASHGTNGEKTLMVQSYNLNHVSVSECFFIESDLCPVLNGMACVFCDMAFMIAASGILSQLPSSVYLALEFHHYYRQL